MQHSGNFLLVYRKPKIACLISAILVTTCEFKLKLDANFHHIYFFLFFWLNVSPMPEGAWPSKSTYEVTSPLNCYSNENLMADEVICCK